MIPLEEIKQIARRNDQCGYDDLVYVWFVRPDRPRVPCRVECWYHPEFTNPPEEDDGVVYTVGSEYFTHWGWCDYGVTWWCEELK